MRTLALKFITLQALTICALADPQPVVAIHPLGPVKAADIQQVKAGIEALYAVTVEILPEKPLPKAAYYPPRGRYKADDITDALSAAFPQAGANKIVGLTTSDISATTDEGKDWGIMGLGQLGGSACVVSTFRLRSGKAGGKLFHARLIKVVNHELGHTFGLDHCPVAACLLQDKRGKIASVDAESGKACAACAARLPLAK